MEYINAKDLKKEFLVYGNFYDLKLSSGQIIPCRNTLEIYNKKRSSSPGIDLFNDKPDALFIMMNPGSSKPQQDGYVPPGLSCTELSKQLLGQSIVKAKPDTTQYQLMRIMKAMNWDHVRVLNLSDIRETKSRLFIKQVQNLGNPIHSIFCSERKEELNKAFAMKNQSHVICAWGTNKGLLKLANLCLKNIPNMEIIGIAAEDNLYYHPLPRLKRKQIEWLDKMMEYLAG